MKFFIMSVIMVFVSGCATVSLSDFEKPDPNVVANSRFTVGLIDNQSGLTNSNKIIGSYINENEEIRKIISEQCNAREKNIIIPLFAKAMSGLIFDSFMDYQIKKASYLEKAAQKSYSQRIILENGTQLNNYNCAYVARYNDKNPIGLFALLKIKKYKDAITLSPIYVKANNTVVVTKKDNNSSAVKINLSFGLSAKTITKKQDGSPALITVGEGVVSVPNVEIGKNAILFEDKNDKNPTSDLIAYPFSDNPVSVTFSVEETGIGVDLDQYQAELKAIKEAMGPVVQTSVGELLKK